MFPILAVLVLVGSGRCGSLVAALAGAGLALAVTLAAAPLPFGPARAGQAVLAGAWIGFLVGSVVLAGLFFRACLPAADGESPPVLRRKTRRSRLFVACFLVGPFMESVTGFGVGQVATSAALRPLGLQPGAAILLGLFSQTLVPWGAMATGTLVGSQLAGVSPQLLGTRTALLMVPLLLGWLALFWSIAARAGVAASWFGLIGELAATLAMLVLLAVANAALGPEVALLAAVGPLIVARCLASTSHLNGADRAGAWRVALPYAGLVAALLLTHGDAFVRRLLERSASLHPIGDGAVYYPLLHPATYLVAIGCLTGIFSGRPIAIASSAARAAWRSGRGPFATIILFLVMARLLSDAGIAQALAHSVGTLLGPAALLATPMIAGAAGFLTGSLNATNGLLMPSQSGLAAEAGLDGAWVAAIQNGAGAALTMLSPIRIAMGCALVGRPDLERATYRHAWPLGAVALFVLVFSALIVSLAR